jgi:recombination protein U
MISKQYNIGMLFKNKGMFIETLVNRTINYIYSNYHVDSWTSKIMLEKRNIAIKVTKKNGSRVEGYLQEKSFLDYFGFIEGEYFEIECKETRKGFIYKSIIRENQKERIRLLNLYSINNFLLINFISHERIFLIRAKDFLDIKKSRIAIEEIENISYSIDIMFPGIVNLFEAIKKLMR